MDNLQKKGTADRSKINMSEAYEVKYWSKELGHQQGQAAATGRQGRQFRRRGAQGTRPLNAARSRR